LVELHFTTKGATKNSFFYFISRLRDQLASGEVSNEIPLMREPSTVWECERYFLVRLTNSSGYSISLGIDIINAHVVAYRVGDRTSFFCDSPPNAWRCLGSKENDSLPFGSNYISLQRTAKVLHRGEIPLGLTELNGAITNLYSDRDSRRVALSLLVCIQMICEAARFRYIEHLVRHSISEGEGFRPNGSMITLENNWDALSRAVQRSIGGAFANPVQLVSPSGGPENVDNVNHISVIQNLALMKFFCRSRNIIINPTPQFSMLIQSVVADDDVCVSEEPTVRIRGPNGLCVDVRDGYYCWELQRI